MSNFKKAMAYLGLADNDDRYVDDAYPETGMIEQQPVAQQPRTSPQHAIQPVARPAQEPLAAPRSENLAFEPIPAARPVESKVTPINKGGAINRISTIHPHSYNDAKLIGESFRNNVPVIMNVSDMGEAEAKRLVDFSAGLVFGMHGTIERVTSKVFLLSPSYVEVVTDDNTAAHEAKYF